MPFKRIEFYGTKLVSWKMKLCQLVSKIFKIVWKRWFVSSSHTSSVPTRWIVLISIHHLWWWTQRSPGPPYAPVWASPTPASAPTRASRHRTLSLAKWAVVRACVPSRLAGGGSGGTDRVRHAGMRKLGAGAIAGGRWPWTCWAHRGGLGSGREPAPEGTMVATALGAHGGANSCREPVPKRTMAADVSERAPNCCNGRCR